MELENHPRQNAIIGKPLDMTDEQCSALSAHVFEFEGDQWTQSLWKPTADELKALTYGGLVSLNVRASGRQHPVVALGVELPLPLPDAAKHIAMRAANLLAAYEMKLPANPAEHTLPLRLGAMIEALAAIG